MTLTEIGRVVGALYLVIALTVILAITIVLAGIHMLPDLVWHAIWNKHFPYLQGAANYHVNVYRWAARDWEWIVTGDGDFTMLP